MGPSIKPKSLSSIIYVPPILYMFLFRANFPLVSRLDVLIFPFGTFRFLFQSGGGNGGERSVGRAAGGSMVLSTSPAWAYIPLIYYTIEDDPERALAHYVYTNIPNQFFDLSRGGEKKKTTCKQACVSLTGLEGMEKGGVGGFNHSVHAEGKKRKEKKRSKKHPEGLVRRWNLPRRERDREKRQIGVRTYLVTIYLIRDCVHASERVG